MTEFDYWKRTTRDLKSSISEALFIFHEIMKGRDIGEELRLRIIKWREDAEDYVDAPDEGEPIG